MAAHTEEEALVGNKSLANLSAEIQNFSQDAMMSSIAERSDNFETQSKLLPPIIAKALIAQGLALFVVTVKYTCFILD